MKSRGLVGRSLVFMKRLGDAKRMRRRMRIFLLVGTAMVVLWSSPIAAQIPGFTPVFEQTTASNPAANVAIEGDAAATSGVNIGVMGTTASTGGLGVRGFATATAGQNFGVVGRSDSPTGTGVFGNVTATSCPTVSLTMAFGQTCVGVVGRSLATSGTGAGVVGLTQSSNGVGVVGVATSSGGIGVLGQAPVGPCPVGCAAVGLAGSFTTLTDSAASFSLVEPFATWQIGVNRPPDNLNLLDSLFFFNKDLNRTMMAITFGGNVGIGTTTPAARLQIGSGGDIFIGNVPTPAALGANLYIENSSGDPKNSLRLDGFADSLFIIGSSAPGAAAGTGIVFRTGTAGAGEADRMKITPEGNVGIGTDAPATPLQVLGDIRVGTFAVNGCVQNFIGIPIAGFCSSDARLKTNIQPFSPLLPKLVQLRPVHFEWKTAEYPEYRFGSGRGSGLIAQEVEKVFPELVGDDGHGYKAVNYSELPMLLLQAIRDLKVENDNLRQQLIALEERLQRLEGAPHGQKH